MSLYPAVVLLMSGMAVYIGLENLLFALYNRQRIHVWLGLLALAEGGYAFASFRLYTSTDAIEGGYHQLWQLFFGAVMLAAIILLGMDYLGRLSRRVIYAVALPAVAALVALPFPGLGVTGVPAVKEVAWLGVTYYEMSLGPAALAWFVLSACWVIYITAGLLRRARIGSRTDRTVAAVYVVWLLASANDMLVSAGVYRSVYVAEYAFFAVVGIMAALLIRQQARSGASAEQRHRELAAEVTARNRDLAAAQAELTHAARLAAVGRLAAGVAHEVNNPLTYLRGNLEMLERELEGDEELVHLVRQSLDGAQRIRKVVSRLYGFSGSRTAGPGNVKAAIDSAVGMARAELKERAGVELDVPPLPAAAISDGHLSQVLLSLLHYSCQSIEPGAEDDNQITIRARLLEDEGLLEIVVEDTGPGIPEADLPSLFEPSSTERVTGDGPSLSLAVARSLLNRAGGVVGAANRVEGGARFTVQIPVHAVTDPVAKTGELPELEYDKGEPGEGRRRKPTRSQELPQLT
jgi:signal transduction histidine kinase